MAMSSTPKRSAQQRTAHAGAAPRARGRATKVDVVFEELRRQILANRLRHDDVFPTERDLAMQFEVSRQVIRDALGRLKGLGLLQSARGNTGTRFKSCSWSETLGAQIASLVTDLPSWKQMSDLRMAVEVGNALEIIDKITDEQIADLRRQYERMLKARTWAELLELDAEFHVKLLQISGNPLIVEFAGVIVNYFKMSPDYDRVGKFATYHPREVTRRRHEPIIEALEERDSAKLIRAMRQHVSDIEEELRGKGRADRAIIQTTR